MSRRSYSLRLSRTARWTRAVLCVVLLCLLPLYALRRLQIGRAEAKPARARMTPAQVKARALTFCAAFDHPCEIIGSPLFSEEDLAPAFGKFHIRRIWYVHCVSEGSLYLLTINDKTGNLAGINYGGEAQGREQAVPPEMQPVTQREAAAISIRRLHDFQMVAPEKEIALAAPPRLVNAGKGWQVIWNVRDTARSSPCQIRLLLARADGFPIMAVNQSEMRLISED